MGRVIDEIFDSILQGVTEKWPSINENIDEFKEAPSNLPLNIFPCYRKTLEHISKDCFPLPEVKLSALLVMYCFTFNLLL